MINLVDVFLDTVEVGERFSVGKTSKVYFKDISNKDTRRYIPIVEVLPKDTVSCLIDTGEGDVCILNMASQKRPGGGVRNGARAQEEALFRCSNLHHSISEDFYPLGIDEALYTEGAIFFKDKDYNLIRTIKTDVITIAAINLNNSFLTKEEYEKITKQKIRLMLSIPKKKGIKTLILGAWGCGVFKNDPKIMSKFFKEVIFNEGFGLGFEKIIFGVINDHNSVGNNYHTFLDTFKD
jgi:uncharacterized protein (TIGR02452 family)